MNADSDRLKTVLRRTGRVTLLAELVRGTLAAAGLLAAAVLLAVALDAVLSLKPWALIAVDCLLGALAAAIVGYLTYLAYRNRYEPRRLARLIETRAGIGDSSLINAVDLAAQPAGSDSPQLRQASVRMGDRRARGVVPRRMVDRRRLRSAALAAALAAAVMAAALAAFPGVFRAVVPRYLRPAADHPPFTLLQFDVRVEPNRVYVGRPATVRAELTGPAEVPTHANVVLLEDAAGQRQAIPMLHAGGGRFVLSIERASRTRRFYIDTPAGRSGAYELKVHQVPQFEQVLVRYEFPSYTGWGPSFAALTANRDIRALAGTQVALTVRSNLPLGACPMVLTDANTGRSIELELGAGDEPGTAEGTFALDFSGRYEIRLLSAEGVASNDAFEGTLTCLPDTAPTVEILEPEQAVVAPEDWSVQLAIRARDDVAVRRVALYRSINGWGPTPTELKLEFAGPTFATAQSEFDLAALGCRPGDLITYFASAQDNHPSQQFADSPTFAIRVIGSDEYLQYARMKYRMDRLLEELDQWRRMQEAIARERDELIKDLEEAERRLSQAGDAVSEEDRNKLQQLAERHAEYAAKLDELAGQMRQRAGKPRLYSFEEPYLDSLVGSAQDMESRARQSRELADAQRKAAKAGPAAAQARSLVRQALGQLRNDRDQGKADQQQTDRVQQQMEAVRKADELVALVERVGMIAQRQRELADRLGQFRNKERLSAAEQIRAKQMAEEQAQLRQDLKQTLEEMDKAAEAAQEELPKMSDSARALAAKVRDLGVLRDQEDAVTLAQAGDGRYAHRASDSAATKLESLCEECGGQEGMMEAGADDLDRQLTLARQKILQGLSELSQSRAPGVGSGGQDGSGSGYYGSRAQVALQGPHARGGRAEVRSGPGRQGRADGRGDSPRPPGSAESLSPEADPSRATGVTVIPGVPPRDRAKAEAYFRRLADESK